MPRSSLGDRLDRASLSRVSAGKGSLGRYSIGTDVSGGSSATRHWVNSVSDIYGPDEIEELLEDLNRLELAAFETEEFDIDGSQCGTMGGARGRGRSRQRNNASPTFSVSSWDSHAIYANCPEEEEEDEGDGVGGEEEDAGGGAAGQGIFPARGRHAILCYCDTSTLKTPRTILRIILLLTSFSCLFSVLTAGSTLDVGLFSLPYFSRLRLLLFVCIFTILFTVFVVVLNISHMNAIMPFDVGRMQTLVYLLLTIAYIVSSLLVYKVHSVYDDPSQNPSFWTKNHLLVAAILGFSCGLQTFLCMFNCGKTKPYDKMLQESSTHFTLHESGQQSVHGGGRSAAAAAAAVEAPIPMLPTRSSRDAEKQYLVNENYRHHPPSAPPEPKSSGGVPAAAAAAASVLPSSSTVPKHNQQATSASNREKPSSSSNNAAAAKQIEQQPPPPPSSKAASSRTKQQNNNPDSISSCKPAQSTARTAADPPLVPPPPSSSSANNNNHSRSPPPSNSAAAASTASTTTAHVEPPSSSTTTEAMRATGAIPKTKSSGKQNKQQQVKPSTNHLDEIIAIPMDDSMSIDIEGSSSRKHYVH